MISQNNRRKSNVTILTVFLVIIGICQVAAAQDLSLDKVITKNIEASGGVEAWAKVKNIKMTGIYTNFSDPETFVIWRARPNRYRFDAKRINMFTVHAYDGKKAWWVNPLMGPPFETPKVIPSRGNLDLVTLRERFFEPVFWNYKTKGNKVELVGKENLDGEDVYKLHVTLKDGSEENWFISGETFLAVAMDGFTYDFGRKCKLEAFFSEYKEVGGVVLPYLIESEYLIRYRTFEVDEIKVNTTFESDVFVMPDSAAWVQKK